MQSQASLSCTFCDVFTCTPANMQGPARVLSFYRTFRSDLRVHKVIRGWDRFQTTWAADFELLQKVYKATRGSSGIVHAVEGPCIHEPNMTSRRRKRSSSSSITTANHYSVVMQPVGLRNTYAEPKSEAELARTAHGLLHGIFHLHKVISFMHSFKALVF